MSTVFSLTNASPLKMGPTCTSFSGDTPVGAQGRPEPFAQCYVTDPAQWNAARLLLKQLYVIDRKELREVMHIMQAEHDFVATEQQYKKRFRAWGFRKYLSDAEAREVFSKTGSHKHFELPARVAKSDKKVLMANVRRHARRKGWRPSAALPQEALECGQSTATALDCAISSLGCVKSSLQQTELVFRAITGYFVGGFESGLWYQDGSLGVTSCREGRSSRYWLSNIALGVVQALTAGRISTAVALASQVCSTAKSYLLIEDFRATKEFIKVARALCLCDSKLARTVMTHIMRMSKALHGPRHPLSVVTEYLSSYCVISKEKEEILQNFLTLLASACAQHLGETHRYSIDVLQWALPQDDHLVARLQHLLTVSDHQHGMLSDSSRCLMDRLGTTLCNLGHFEHVRQTSAAMRQRAVHAVGPSDSFCWRWLAARLELHSAQMGHDLDLAEALIREQLLPLAEEEHGNCEKKMEILVALFDCLNERGKFIEAREIQCELDELTIRLQEDLSI